MRHLGDFAPGAVVYAPFTTAGADGARIAFSDALEAGDIRVYKNGGTTERSSTSGFTVSTAFDSLVGVHMVAIDTSDNTDAGFYVPGSEFAIVLYPDTETVDSKAPSAILATFSIGRKAVGVAVQGFAQAGAAGSVTLPSTAVATDDYYKGDLLYILSGTGAGQMNYCNGYVGSTKVASVTPNWITNPDTTSWVIAIAGARAAVDANVTGIDSGPVTSIQSGLATSAALATAQSGITAISGYVDTEVAAIKAKTDNLPANPAAVSDIPTATTIRNAILNWEPFTGYTLAKILRAIGIVLFGTKTGSDTSTEVFTSPADGKTVTAAVDASGNRSAVTTDASGTP